MILLPLMPEARHILSLDRYLCTNLLQAPSSDAQLDASLPSTIALEVGADGAPPKHVLAPIRDAILLTLCSISLVAFPSPSPVSSCGRRSPASSPHAQHAAARARRAGWSTPRRQLHPRLVVSRPVIHRLARVKLLKYIVGVQCAHLFAHPSLPSCRARPERAPCSVRHRLQAPPPLQRRPLRPGTAPSLPRRSTAPASTDTATYRSFGWFATMAPSRPAILFLWLHVPVSQRYVQVQDSLERPHPAQLLTLPDPNDRTGLGPACIRVPISETRRILSPAPPSDPARQYHGEHTLPQTSPRSTRSTAAWRMLDARRVLPFSPMCACRLRWPSALLTSPATSASDYHYQLPHTGAVAYICARADNPDRPADPRAPRDRLRDGRLRDGPNLDNLGRAQSSCRSTH